MQKICIAIVLALALTCVVADYTPTAAGWVKVPVTICADNETACNNATHTTLLGLTSSDVNLAAYADSVPVVATNTSSASWSLYTKAIIVKDLSSTANTTYAYKAGQYSSVLYGFAVTLGIDNSTGANNIWLYQTKLAGAVELPRVQVTNNTNANYTPQPVGVAFTTKTIYIFYTVTDGKNVNATSYAIGTSTRGKDVVITAALNSSEVQTATGEALSSSQVYATWQESPTALKAAVVDFSAGTVNSPVDIGGYITNYTGCAPYSTDKKYYGVWCQYPNNGTNTIFISSTNTTLTKLFTVANSSVQSVDSVIAYGPYLAFFYTNPSVSPVALSYDTWDLEKFNTTKTNTPYLTKEANTTITQYRIPQGGLYVLAVNNRAGNGTNSKIQVGLLMGASYLTTVFGFLLTIIAGLFLF